MRHNNFVMNKLHTINPSSLLQYYINACIEYHSSWLMFTDKCTIMERNMRKRKNSSTQRKSLPLLNIFYNSSPQSVSLFENIMHA
jgi:hypothetical protein